MKLSQINKSFWTITIVLIATFLSIFGSLSSTYNQTAKASPLPLLNKFTFGFSNDVYPDYRNSTFGGAGNAKLLSGPWFQTTWDAYGDEHTSWLSKFNEPANSDKTPYFYAYIAAGKAKSAYGLNDCNVASPDLCHQGANFIRANNPAITQGYTDFANKIKQIYGTTKPVVIHPDPDFYQYTENAQQNGPLTFAQMQSYMNQWTSAVKAILPNSVLVMDVSPWNNNIAGMASGLTNFDYAGLVGKRYPPSGVDGKTYAQISSMTGKKIILNDAHGVNGALMSYPYNWEDRTTVQNAWNEGVVAVLMPGNSGTNSQLANTITSYTDNPIPAGTITTSSSTTNSSSQAQSSIVSSQNTISSSAISSVISSAVNQNSQVSSQISSQNVSSIANSSQTSSNPFECNSLPNYWNGKFINNWESNFNLQSSGKFYDSNRSIVIKDSRNALETIFNSGSYGVNETNVPVGGTGFKSKTFNQVGVDEACFSYYQYLEPGFDFNKGGKLPGFYGGIGNTGGNVPSGSDGFSTRLMWRSNGRGQVYAYLPSSVDFGTQLGTGTWNFETGRWQKISQYLKLNTPNQNDGSVTMWIDGVEKFNTNNLNFRNTTDLKIDGILGHTFFGGNDPSWASPKTQKLWWADFDVKANVSNQSSSAVSSANVSSAPVISQVSSVVNSSVVSSQVSSQVSSLTNNQSSATNSSVVSSQNVSSQQTSSISSSIICNDTPNISSINSGIVIQNSCYNLSAISSINPSANQSSIVSSLVSSVANSSQISSVISSQNTSSTSACQIVVPLNDPCPNSSSSSISSANISSSQNTVSSVVSSTISSANISSSQNTVSSQVSSVVSSLISSSNLSSSTISSIISSQNSTVSSSQTSTVSSNPNVIRDTVIDFGDGKNVQVQVLNSDCRGLDFVRRFSDENIAVNSSKFVEFKAKCNKAEIKTYWNGWDVNLNYNLIKYNPVRKLKNNNPYKAVFGKEWKNAKFVLTTTHIIDDNQDGDYSTITTEIWDPYTLELVPASTPVSPVSPIPTPVIPVNNPFQANTTITNIINTPGSGFGSGLTQGSNLISNGLNSTTNGVNINNSNSNTNNNPNNNQNNNSNQNGNGNGSNGIQTSNANGNSLVSNNPTNPTNETNPNHPKQANLIRTGGLDSNIKTFGAFGLMIILGLWFVGRRRKI